MEKRKIGAGILIIDVSSGKVLLERRGVQTKEPNTWSTFGGTFEEKDITPKETAKREFEEETKINVPYKISKKPVYVSKNNHLTHYMYLGLVDYQFPIEMSDESLGCGWFNIDELPGNLLPDFQEFINEMKPTIKDVIQKHQKTIQ